MSKTAIITGASGGVGCSIAKHLTKLGYTLGLMGRDENKLKLLKQELITELNTFIKVTPVIMTADVCDKDAVNLVVENFIDATGDLCVLVNNAGIMKPGTTDLDYKIFHEILNTNLVGTFNCIKAVAPYMKKQKSGYIFNIASTAGKLGFAELGGYSASKFGMVGLGDSVLKELIHYGIKVTTLCPNLMSTEMTKDLTVMPHNKMIPVEDIGVTIEYLLKLSPNTVVAELNLDCSELIGYS